MIIYPTRTTLRDTERAFEIDDNDPEFIRDPHGLFAVYLGHEPVLILRSTETEGHWDVVTKVWGVHLDKLQRLINEAALKQKEPFNGYT